MPERGSYHSNSSLFMRNRPRLEKNWTRMNADRYRTLFALVGFPKPTKAILDSIDVKHHAHQY